jgi:hypothetical protein
MEDNTASARVIETGKNPTMRHLGRTHKVCIQWIHERFQEKDMLLTICPTALQAADIFTKAFSNADKWKEVIGLINHGKRNQIFTKCAIDKLVSAAPSITDDRRQLYPKRTLVEFCCGPESLLGSYAEEFPGCKVIRLTIEDDVPTDEGINKALIAVDNKCMLWASMPCTGGSPWQNINKLKPNGAILYQKHRRVFKKLWLAFEQTDSRCIRNGGAVSF